MKKKIWIGLATVVALVIAFIAYRIVTTSGLSPAKVATYSSNGLDLKVTYGSPSKRGRLIFGDEKDGALQPYGKYWRLGANEATEVTFNKDVTFAGKPVKAGTYRMYAVPGATSFKIGLNTEVGKWGAFEPNYENDVLTVDIPVEKSSEVEQELIEFAEDGGGVKMVITWDTTKLIIPITAQ